MPWKPYPPLPRETVRDLLGITRALYRATLANDPRDVVRLQALVDIGNGFREALKKATGHPGTIPYQEGWAAANRATKALCALVDESTSLAPLLKATAQKLEQEPLMLGTPTKKSG
jgi:hypothetical protein